MSSKIDHKELQKRLKEDEVAVMIGELSKNTRSIVQQFGSLILMGLAVIIIAYVAYQMWQRKNDSDFVAVQEQFAVANTLMQQENYETAVQQYGKLLTDFPNSELSPIAHLLRADGYFKQEDYQNALSDYQAALGGLTGSDIALAQNGIIQSYRSLNQPAEALAVVQDALKNAKSDELRNQYLYLQGACYMDSGDNAKALESFSNIDSDSSWFSQARQHIEWLQAEAVSAIN